MDVIIDLRNGLGSAGLLIENGNLRWISQLLKTHVDKNLTYDSREEIDLACFQKDGLWRAIQRDSDINGCELIDILSDELSELDRKSVLRFLLKETLEEYKGKRLLFLVDKNGLESFLKRFSDELGRECQVIIPPNDAGEIQAYALWKLKDGNFPKEGDTIQCKCNEEGNGEKKHAFVWKSNKFEKTSPTKRETIEVDMNYKYLEKVGVVFFERSWGQQWKERRLRQIQAQLPEWRDKIKDAKGILVKLKQIHFSRHVAGNV
jgi:hypothetical protein